MPAANTPDAEIEIDEPLIRHLLETQSPERARLSLGFLDLGWDNVLFRLGDDEIVRLPRRQLGANLVEHEQTWLHRLAPGLPLQIPTPRFHGRPTERYPWRWSICPWIEGAPASVAPPTDTVAGATALGEFIAALHRAAPSDAPRNPHRGHPLAERDEITRTRAAQLADLIDADVVIAAWARASASTPWAGPPTWVHGDLHPGNLIVDDGRLVAVIDFGDLCSGDPATDLGVAWMLFDTDGRAALRAAARVDDATWERGRAWAISLAVAVLSSSADRPEYEAFAHHALNAAVVEHD